MILLKNKKNEIVGTTIVDQEDYERVNKYKWHLSHEYAISTNHGRLNRFVMNAKKGDPFIDHINGIKLDNRKINLRYVTHSQNSQNKNKKNGCSSKYIGVSFCKLTKRWKCCIDQTYFDKEDHSGYWYDQLAKIKYGIGAKINNIELPIDFIVPKNKKILPKGISLTKSNTYQVDLQNNNKRTYLGSYKTLDEAIIVCNNKKEEFKTEEHNQRHLLEIVRNAEGIAKIDIINKNKNYECLVDDDKYHDLIKYCWISHNGYAVSTIDKKLTSIHRYLLNCKKNEIVDHINNNKMDNRILNLRICDDSVNNHNKEKKEGLSSKYIGVSLTKHNMYHAYITKDKKRHYIGIFKTAEEAAIERDKKAIELYGNDAKLTILNK